MLHLPILVTVNLSSRTDVQTDVQNVPVDTFNGTLKLRLSLMYVLWWCIGKAQNYFSAAPYLS